jgi:ATP-binding cassette subfamily G (WHITE) protein 2 (SNQ2)
MDKAEEKVQDALNLNHPEDRTGAKPTLAGNQNQPYYAAHAEKDSQTPDNLADVEKESRPQPIPMQLERRQTGVDVKGAESEFAELQREFSKQSQQLSRQHTRQSTKKGTQDVEKAISSGSSDSGEPFDLEDTLRGNKQLEEDSGIKGKKIGVIWDKLTVRGIGGVKNYQPTFPDAFVSFLNVPGTLMSLFGLGGKGKEVNILQDFRGVVKPGEMVLVLGRPGSGCTTFLKVLSNQRFGYTGIDGEVMYGPFTSKDFEKRYRGEAVYCQEDDIHHPTLTVGQTLGFGLDTKVPGNRPGGVSKNEFKNKVVDMLLRMFNIEHTKNTIVGNPFVRGISGGERKRVSIAEMMITGAAVCSHDNSTRGLDASTALDYAKSLRVLTNIYHQTTFVSLYQASENIYSQFDKVLVIDEGRQVYFGPVKEARAYFEGLGFLEKPRQTTPDYLTGCTDRFEREYKEGRDPSNAPSTPDALAEAFNKSTYAAQLDAEMAQYREVVKEEQHVFEVGVLYSVPPASLGTHAKTIHSQMAGPLLACRLMGDFNSYCDHSRHRVAPTTSDLCRRIHQRWSSLHLTTVQRFPGIRRIGFDHVRSAYHQQTSSIRIPSTFSAVDRTNRCRPGFLSCANLAILYHRLLHVWSSPRSWSVLHLLPHDRFWLPCYDTLLPYGRLSLPRL